MLLRGFKNLKHRPLTTGTFHTFKCPVGSGCKSKAAFYRAAGLRFWRCAQPKRSAREFGPGNKETLRKIALREDPAPRHHAGIKDDLEADKSESSPNRKNPTEDARAHCNVQVRGSHVMTGSHIASCWTTYGTRSGHGAGSRRLECGQDSQLFTITCISWAMMDVPAGKIRARPSTPGASFRRRIVYLADSRRSQTRHQDGHGGR